MLNLDILINSRISEIWNPYLNKFMIFITEIGSSLILGILSLILLIYLFYKKRYKNSILVIISMIGGLIIRTILKISIQRLRPENSLISETGYSFPSGHALMSVIFFLLLIYLFHKEIKNKIIQVIFIAINVILILLISFSRIYLNVHWFSDVVGGLIIGISWLIISIIITNKIINSKILRF